MYQLKNISKVYQNHIVLNDFSCEWEEGKVHGIIGHNGAGKSTLMKIISGLVYPDRGEILRGNRPFRESTKIGAMIEYPAFFHTLTAFQNLRILADFYPDVTNERIHQVLEMTGLSKQEDALYSTFSTGMRQRLAFAFALMPGPDLILLDEPFNAIDPPTRQLFRLLIENMAKAGVTIILSSHDLAEVSELCDTVLLMNEGKIIFRHVGKNEDLEDIFFRHLGNQVEAQ